MATICWASTSSGLGGMHNTSNSQRRIASNKAKHSIKSSRLVGNSRPLGIPPRKCPDRPTRCSNVPMEPVVPNWQTKSTSPISMPNSSDAVATNALSFPSFKRHSADRRCSRAKLPWWEVTFSSPMRSLRARAKRSAIRRVLTKMSVVRCSAINSAMRS